mgnify:CR=1 FL=1
MALFCGISQTEVFHGQPENVKSKRINNKNCIRIHFGDTQSINIVCTVHNGTMSGFIMKKEYSEDWHTGQVYTGWLKVRPLN